MPIQSAHSETNVRIISEQMHDTDIKTTLNRTHQYRSEKVRVPRAGVRSGIKVTKKHELPNADIKSDRENTKEPEVLAIDLKPDKEVTKEPRPIVPGTVVQHHSALSPPLSMFRQELGKFKLEKRRGVLLEYSQNW